MQLIFLPPFRRSLPMAMLALAVPAGLYAQCPQLSRKQAQIIALKLHGGKVKSGELEEEHGIQIYSFDILTKQGLREVGIDAQSGKVVEDKLESAADEAKEKAEEKAKNK